MASKCRFNPVTCTNLFLDSVSGPILSGLGLCVPKLLVLPVSGLNHASDPTYVWLTSVKVQIFDFDFDFADAMVQFFADILTLRTRWFNFPRTF